jgi:hypothetical protein
MKTIIIKSRDITVTGRGGLSSCEMLRIPHCLDSLVTDGRTSLPRNITFLLLVLIYVGD